MRTRIEHTHRLFSPPRNWRILLGRRPPPGGSDAWPSSWISPRKIPSTRVEREASPPLFHPACPGEWNGARPLRFDLLHIEVRLRGRLGSASCRNASTYRRVAPVCIEISRRFRLDRYSSHSAKRFPFRPLSFFLSFVYIPIFARWKDIFPLFDPRIVWSISPYDWFVRLISCAFETVDDFTIKVRRVWWSVERSSIVCWSRNVNRRSIVNIYIAASRKRESKKPADLITEWCASIILPMALWGNKYE